MKFSVIIPAHNAENHIRKGLDSIAQQTFKDYELIVICDNCEDNTESIAKQYGAITKNVNFGRDGLTRNIGLDMAQGEWILFMDDDDWWLHEFVFQQINNKLSDNIDLLAFSFIFKGWQYATPLGNLGKHWYAPWSKCYRRSFINGCKFSDEWSISDVTFYNEVMVRCPRILDWDMPMYYYNYLREGSMSQIDGHGIPK